jgi:hypothetical protein
LTSGLGEGKERGNCTLYYALMGVYVSTATAGVEQLKALAVKEGIMSTSLSPV